MAKKKTTDSPETPTLSKGERTRLAIVQEAIKLFAKYGITQTTFEMIAQKVEIKTPAIMNYFLNRTELMQGCIEYIIDHNYRMVTQAFSPKMDAHQRLIAHAKSNAEWAATYPNEANLLLVLYQMAHHSEVFAELCQKIMQTGRERIATHLFAGLRERIYNFNEAEVEDRASQVHHYLTGSIISLLVIPQKAKLKVHLTQLESGIERLLQP